MKHPDINQEMIRYKVLPNKEIIRYVGHTHKQEMIEYEGLKHKPREDRI